MVRKCWEKKIGHHPYLYSSLTIKNDEKKTNFKGFLRKLDVFALKPGAAPACSVYRDDKTSKNVETLVPWRQKVATEIKELVPPLTVKYKCCMQKIAAVLYSVPNFN